MHARNLVRQFATMMRSEDGVVAIEAAIIFPVGFALIMVTLELILYVFANAGLDSVARNMAYLAAQECPADKKTSSDGGMTVRCVQPMSAADRETELRRVLSTYVGGLINPADLCIRVHPITSPSSTTDDLGGSNDIVRYEFDYEWKFFTILVDRFFHDANKFHTVYLVRNGEIQNATGASRHFSWPGACPP